MPLYTFVVTHRGQTCVVQDRHSNPKGFTKSWSRDLPPAAFPGFTEAVREKLERTALRDATFEEVPNRRHVWRRVVAFDGLEFEVHIIQTEA